MQTSTNEHFFQTEASQEEGELAGLLKWLRLAGDISCGVTRTLEVPTDLSLEYSPIFENLSWSLLCPDLLRYRLFNAKGNLPPPLNLA